MVQQSTSAGRDNALSRDMGLLSIVATVVAGTLGAGLFVTIGTASTTTGPSVILATVITGVVAIAIALSYGWIATIFPAAGGAYTYVSRTTHNRMLGFVVTWTKWLGYMAACAALAVGFGGYFSVFFPDINPTLSGLALMTVLFVANLFGTKGYASVQNIMFYLLLLSILVLVVPGLFAIDTANYQPFFTGGFSGFTASAVPLFYAYIGIEVAAQFGAEVRNPGRNMPLAMIGGTALLAFLYTITAVVIYGVVSDYTVLAESEQPLATAAEVFLGDVGTAIVAVGGLLATATSVHAVMAAAIKIPYSWSWDRIAPEFLSHVNQRFRTPHWSLLTLFIVSGLLLFWTDGLGQVIAIATFSYLIAYAAVALCAGYLYLKRATSPLAARAIATPGWWFYLAVTTAFVGSVVLITQAANWPALFSGNWGDLSTLAIYFPWLTIGIVIFVVFWRQGQARGDDVDALLDAFPGVSTDDTGHEPGQLRPKPEQ